MLLNPLILGVSIDFWIVINCFNIKIYNLSTISVLDQSKNLVNEKTIVEDLEKTIEIRIEEIDGSDHYKQYLKI